MLLGQELGVSVHTASSEHEATTLLREEDFDVIVTGYYFSEWPPDGGYRRIMSAARYQGFNIPVIFMAHRVSSEDAFEAAKLGAFDFLLLDKPIHPSTLVNAVKSALELRRIPKVFISYSSNDRAFAARLAHEIYERGWQVWYDIWEVKVGDSLAQKIEEGITSSSFLIVLLSKTSVQSKWVREEIDAAFVRQLEEQSIKILPALLEDCTIPALLRSRRYADFRESFDTGMRSIVQSIKTSAQPLASS